MCQQQQQLSTNANKANACGNINKLKPNYSIKRVLQTFFKRQQKCQQQQHFTPPQRFCNSLESLESLDNLRNSQMEQHFYDEIGDNSANEKLAQMIADDTEEEAERDIYVPVRFARTQAGTFFWTTNLQPVTSSIAPAADEDLLQPAYCYSNCQYPRMQYQDRWAQA